LVLIDTLLANSRLGCIGIFEFLSLKIKMPDLLRLLHQRQQQDPTAEIVHLVARCEASRPGTGKIF
jgi:hypothetical protein